MCTSTDQSKLSMPSTRFFLQGSSTFLGVSVLHGTGYRYVG